MDVDGSGAGRMVRAARTINRCVVLGLCLALACAPSVVVGLFVSATPLGLVLYVLGLVAVAPALSAGLYAVRGWRRDPGAGSARLFLRGYRMNVVDVLRWWVPTLVAAAVLAVNVGYAGDHVAGPLLRAAGIAAGVVLALWAGNALVVSSFFSFRTRDVARIAAAEMFLSWRVTLGLACLLLVAAAAVYVAGDGAMLLLAWVFVVLLELVARPLVAHVTARFTPAEPDAG